MNNKVAKGILMAAGLAAVAAPAFGQSQGTSNQRWDIRYVVQRFAVDSTTVVSTQTYQQSWSGTAWSALSLFSSSGDLSSKQNIGRVDITLQGRVGIVGTAANFGVNRLGGSGAINTSGVPSGYFLRFNDPSTFTQAGLSAASIARGTTGEIRNSNPLVDVAGAAGEPAGYTGGSPVAGTFAAFRVGFTPLGAEFAQGSNYDSNNGIFFNPGTATGPVSAANFVGGRASGFGLDTTTTALGVATLDGSNAITGGNFADFYRLTYTPKADYSNVDSQVYRQITVDLGAQTTRYLFQRNTANSYSQTNGPTAPAATGAFSFFVPTPGAASVLGLAALAGLRRRR